MARSSTCVARCPALLLPGSKLLRAEIGAFGVVADGRPLPRLKTHGGHLTRDNLRLAHRLCNQRDYPPLCVSLIAARRRVFSAGATLVRPRCPRGVTRWARPRNRRRGGDRPTSFLSSRSGRA